MSLAVIKATKGRERPTISPEKGNELVGLLLLALGIILALSLATYHPGDPSLFHKVAEEGARARNWVGPFGAHAAAVTFSFFGLTCLLIPVFLIVAGWRRLRRQGAMRVVGRGFGAMLLLAATPALLQLTLGRIHWQDGSIASGGAFGKLLVELLESYFSFAGSLVLLIAVSACGLVLVVQSTLGDVLAAWRDRLRHLWDSYTLARERRRERREKERARRRVITKHLQRVVEEKQKKEEEEPHIPHTPKVPSKRMMQLVQPVKPLEAEPPVDRIDLPLRPTGRITERRGEAEFGVRKVSASELREEDEFHSVREAVRAASEAPVPVAPRKKAAPQPPLPFVAEIAPGTLPPVNLLQMGDGRSAMDEAELVRLGETIRNRCAEFGVDGTVEAISPGPVITVFEFQPAPGVKVSQIVNLQDDLALALRAESVRIDRMPGRSTLGIEVPNKERAVIR
ncbi:MAG TPA: DNA translocase FtsK 4TM domain-containing protein, partial [Thermoanaerobaculia bacterium]|nr:DNA translocase FtsK 4TM domain-containing protein [Thermoanaerobaculia bacterium]